MKQTCTRLGLIMGLLLASPNLSFAHAHMNSSDPKKDSVVEKLPSEVRLSFTEELEPSMSKIEVKNESSNEVVSEKKLSEQSGGDVLVAKLKSPSKTMAGNYTVKWKAVSKDSHKMTGQFGFKVQSAK
jgi:copper resistance protein C